MSSDDSSSEFEFELPLNISDDKYYISLEEAERLQSPVTQPAGPETAAPALRRAPASVHQPRWSAPRDVDLQIPRYGSSTIQHSQPSYDLWRPLFPTHVSDASLRNFHRPKLRHYKVGLQAIGRRPHIHFPVKNLSRNIYRAQKRLRHQVIRAIREGMTREEIVEKFLLIHKARDLSAKQGEQFLFEYAEEFPPVLSQIGMASNIKNYVACDTLPRTVGTTKPMPPPPPPPPSSPKAQHHRPHLSGDSACEPQQLGRANQADNQRTPLGNYKIGYDEQPSAQRSVKNNQLYYCHFDPGTKFRVIENNLYRAPIFEQRDPKTDFIIIRTRNSFYIRPLKNIFTVGQTFPLVAVPAPRENVISQFRSRFSNTHIHKLFKWSKTDPQTLDFDQLAKLFPDYSRETLRNRLKSNGAVSLEKDRNTFVRGQSKYGLMPLKDLRRYFTPEEYCLNMAALRARERLRELNYTDTMILPTSNDTEKEAEVLAAPWNTTQAVINAVRGKNYLDFKLHLVDPTESTHTGFSCVAWSKSPSEDQQRKEQLVERSVLDSSRNDLSSIPSMNPLAYKIKREKLERLAIYQKAAREIVALQARTLAQQESDSSDEEQNDEAFDDENLLDESFERDFQKLCGLVEEGKTIEQFNNEQEEEERRRMIQEFKLGPKEKNQPNVLNKFMSNMSSPIGVTQFKNKILKITRTYDTSEDGIMERTEIVRDPKIISLYVRQKRVDESHNCSQEMNENVIDVDTSTSLPDRTDISPQRRESASLGPSELCRTDGIVVTISKKVLNSRALRHMKRRSSGLSY